MLTTHRQSTGIFIKIKKKIYKKKKVLAEAGKANMIPFPVTRSAIRDSIAACIQVRNALANKAGLNYLRTLAPSWTQAKQARAARKEAKVPRRQVHLSGARMAFG